MSINRVLVTGGTGLIGTAIDSVSKDVKYTSNYEFKFIGSRDADLTNYDHIKLIFESFRPTHVIHLGAKVGGLFSNMANNLDFFRLNSLINDNVLRLAFEFNVKKCISCLSTCIFPDQITYPITENMVHNGPPHNSNFGYSYAKRMIDILNHAYDDRLQRIYSENKPVFTSVIPTNVYGPNDNFNPDHSHVIAALILKTYLAAKQAISDGNSKAVLTVCGTGKPLRQFIYSEDLAKLILWVLESYDQVDPIILSVDEQDEVEIGRVAKLVADTMGKQFNIPFELEYDTSFSDGQFKKTADNSKLKSLIGSFDFTNIEDGIERSVKWFVNNYDTCRK